MTIELESGLRDELLTADLARALAAISSDRAVTAPLTDAEAIERLGRHLLRVARRMDQPKGKEQVQRVAEVVNAAIAQLGADFAPDHLELPATLLGGVKPAAHGVEVAALPPAPSIPLSTTELLVNGDGQPTLGQLLLEEIRCATHIDLICAFVGWTGVSQLLDELRALRERGGTMRVVTSTYLGATSRKALDALVELGAEVAVRYDGNATKLHAKSWLFHRPGELDTAYIGSSNLSQAALHDGIEWNVRLARADAPAVFARMQGTFDTYWNDASYEIYGATRDEQARLDAELRRAKGSDTKRHDARSQQEIARLEDELADAYSELALRPRPHQQQILDTLELQREQFDRHRHLIVAATGTGKTVIAALDYARMCIPSEPRPSLLFVAHREQILVQARRTFAQVLRDPSFGQIVGGSAGDATAGRHVFAMVQTVSSERRIADLQPDAYEIVYIDEAHHVTADSWTRLIKHLEPRELVGLTATPERADGQNVEAMFGGAFTSELRLWEAIDDQLLAPFHYIGIDDGTDLRSLAWSRGDYAVGDLSDLYTGDHRRVKIAIEAIHRWIERPAQMRALGFCITKDHALFMTEQFERHGFRAAYLTGDDPQSEREAVLDRLKRGELQIVFSVDVLGEGVDVPDVDTLLLLRPTQSPVLFAQQLGRGLRHAPGKSCCVVLDLIGQHRSEYRYDQRYQALMDMRHGSVRAQAERGFPYLPAGSAIVLERIARERVLEALKQLAAKPGAVALRKDLETGRDATLADFLARTERTTRDLYNPKDMSWTKLRRLAGQVVEEGSDDAARLIGNLQHVTDPWRINLWTSWFASPSPPNEADLTTAHQRSAVQLFHLLLRTPTTIDEGFAQLWREPAVREEILELLAINATTIDANPIPLVGLADVPLHAHVRYARTEVFAALGISDVGKMKEHREGVYFHKPSRTQLMFVTLHKDETRYAPSVQYRDHALSPSLFHWESPNSWRQDSPAMLRCIGRGEGASDQRLLFVREAARGWSNSRFRLFGQVDLTGDLVGERPVALTWELRQPLPEVVFESARLLAVG